MANATLFIDDKGQGQLQLAGDGDMMQSLTGMLVMRLSQEYAEAEIRAAHEHGKDIHVDLKVVANMILKNIQKKIDSLTDFQHA